MYKRILIAVDGSENSQRAALHAAKLAITNSNASITALYVLNYDRTRTDVLLDADIADLHLRRKERIEPILDIFIKHQVKHELVIRHGEPGPTIIAYANENKYDLVVIGSRGLNSFQEMLLGSVSHKVAKRVIAPVLIVK
ncbi:universal stress protein [Sporosarcina thermotolerans]|uniref:Universal stress protein n=1 Tax=Sporosarcina thermotolerans TaxID=633404 RepID=A0AAW9A9C9_9BACL|nr:universal stress protein [Sporosarcina thermotolerans]MDW0118022.1 universal stress protein [Sporosarcina thermotolerans]WHT49086.1 universal stress protein [Sporosarcina thermotolerans]